MFRCIITYVKWIDKLINIMFIPERRRDGPRGPTYLLKKNVFVWPSGQKENMNLILMRGGVVRLLLHFYL